MRKLKILGLVLAVPVVLAALVVNAPTAETLTTTEFTTENNVGTTVTSEVAAGTVHEFTV